MRRMPLTSPKLRPRAIALRGTVATLVVFAGLGSLAVGALAAGEMVTAHQPAVADPPRAEAPDPGPADRPGPPLHPVKGEADYGGEIAAFGHARGRLHAGQDVFAPAGTPLISPRRTVVLESGNDGGRGNWVALYHKGRDETYVYFHMLGAAEVGPGDRLRPGAKVGEVGCTGSCSGDHLHFEIREGRGPYGEPRDPLPELKRWNRV